MKRSSLERPCRHSLMELAGLDDTDDAKAALNGAARAPNVIERLSADEAEFDDVVPQHFKAAPKTQKAAG